MADLTIITRSKEPFDRVVPEGVVYLNHVSIITDRRSECIENAKAIRKVQTPYFTLVDHDDDIPEYLPLPTKGILYGDLLIEEDGKLTRTKVNEFSDKHFMEFPYLLHKPIYNTQNMLWILDNLPDSNGLHFNMYYHYFLAMLFGANYDSSYDAVWKKQSTGLHTRAYPNMQSLREWMNGNRFSTWLRLQTQLSRERKNVRT